MILNLILPLGLFIAFAGAKVFQAKKWWLLIGLLFLVGSYQLVADNFLHPNRALTWDYAYLQSGTDFEHLVLALHSLPQPLQIIGLTDELLYVETEDLDRRFEPFTPGLPVYLNYQHSFQAMLNLLGSDQNNYVHLVYQYFEPGPVIDLLVRKDVIHDLNQSYYPSL